MSEANPDVPFMSRAAHLLQFLCVVTVLITVPASGRAQADPSSEPAVLAVGKAMPAVVNINTERIVKRTFQDPYDAFFREFFGGPMRPPRELRQRVQSLGSGFIVDPTGYIVTNEHVVERAEDLKIQVTASDGKTYEARYVSGDPSTDLAFIKIECDRPLPYIDLNDPSPNLLGQSVLALGNPLGYGSSVSRGILSATNRAISINEQEYRDLLQTDAAINPGNSGGPLIDLLGKLVGVNSVKMAYTPQGIPTQGIGFAIPATVVRDRVAGFMKEVRHPRPKSVQTLDEAPLSLKLFGLQVQDLNESLRDALGYQSANGVLIADVVADSPAEAAGLRRGQVIYKVGRYEINSVKTLESLLKKARRGMVADFVVGTVRKVQGQYVQQLTSVTVTAR
jgi:serine protease Do